MAEGEGEGRGLGGGRGPKEKADGTTRPRGRRLTGRRGSGAKAEYSASGPKGRDSHLTSRQLLPEAIWRAKQACARAYTSASAPADTGRASSGSGAQGPRGSSRPGAGPGPRSPK